jgi:ankyrin repeat protein
MLCPSYPSALSPLACVRLREVREKDWPRRTRDVLEGTRAVDAEAWYASYIALRRFVDKLFAAEGEWATVWLLRDAGEEALNTKRWDGNTCLMAAAHDGHERLLRLLLRAGADKDLRSNGGRNALMWAEKRGHRACALLLQDRDVRMTRSMTRAHRRRLLRLQRHPS